jgi:hypothetical protein
MYAGPAKAIMDCASSSGYDDTFVDESGNIYDEFGAHEAWCKLFYGGPFCRAKL